MAITAMPHYEKYSFEELRLGDYLTQIARAHNGNFVSLNALSLDAVSPDAVSPNAVSLNVDIEPQINTLHVRWEATRGKDGIEGSPTDGLYMAITAMPHYEKYSFQELRLGDYLTKIMRANKQDSNKSIPEHPKHSFSGRERIVGNMAQFSRTLSERDPVLEFQLVIPLCNPPHDEEGEEASSLPSSVPKDISEDSSLTRAMLNQGVGSSGDIPSIQVHGMSEDIPKIQVCLSLVETKTAKCVVGLSDNGTISLDRRVIPSSLNVGDQVQLAPGAPLPSNFSKVVPLTHESVGEVVSLSSSSVHVRFGTTSNTFGSTHCGSDGPLHSDFHVSPGDLVVHKRVDLLKCSVAKV